MKNKFLFVVLLFSGINFFGSCKKYSLVANNGNSVALYNCSSNSTEAYICFDSLLNDSRCPKGGECIWQGNALIKVSFHENGNTHQFKMSLKGFPGYSALGFPGDTAIAGYRIEFTDLKPYPDIHKPAPKESDIRAVFNISH